MKDGSHPHYRPMVFHDRAAGDAVLTRSTAASTATITWEDGAEGCAGAATHRTAPLVPTVRLAWHRALWASRACSSSQEGVGPGSVLASPVRG